MLLFINGDVKIRSTLRTEWVTQPKSGMTRREFHLQQILWKEPIRPGMNVSRTVISANDNPVNKTIYDPCPVGFKLPASNAFTGFTTTGESVSSSTQVNGTWSSSEKGWYFYTNSEKTQSIFFPAVGYRSYSTMRPGSIGTQGCFWSAHPVAKGNNYYLRTSSVDVQPTYMVDRGFGYALRPCQD